MSIIQETYSKLFVLKWLDVSYTRDLYEIICFEMAGCLLYKGPIANYLI